MSLEKDAIRAYERYEALKAWPKPQSIREACSWATFILGFIEGWKFARDDTVRELTWQERMDL